MPTTSRIERGFDLLQNIHDFGLCRRVCWLGRGITYAISWIQKQILAVKLWGLSFFQARNQTCLKQIRNFHVRPMAIAELDPTMQDLQAFITQVFGMIGTSVYTNKIQPAINSLIKNPQISPSAQNAWEKFSLQIATVIATEITKIFGDAMAASSGELKILLSWLLGDKATDTLEQVLSSTYKDALQSKPQLVSEFLSWFKDTSWLSTNAAIPDPQGACPGADSGTLQSLLITAIQTLIDSKVKAFVQTVYSSLANNAQGLIQTTIQTNSTIIGQAIGTQFASLIQATAPKNPPLNLPTIYQQSYDQVLTLIFNQVNAIASCANSDLNTMLTAFAKSDACDPVVRSLLNPPSGVDADAYRAEVEKNASDQIATRLIALLLPDETSQAGGITLTTPGIVLLLRKLQFPALITQAYNTFVSWDSTLFPNGAPATAELLVSSVTYFLEKGASSIIYDQLKAGLSLGLLLGMNYVVPPEFLNMWMVQGAFPAIFQALVQALLANALRNPSDAIVRAFMPLASASCNRQAAYAALVPLLYIPVYNACNGIDLQKVGWNMVVFGQNMVPFLDQISDYLSQQAGSNTASSSQVKSWLEQYNAPVDAGQNSTYGNLLMDLMFHVGSLKLLGSESLGRELCGVFFKNLMSRGLTSALNPLRTNEELVVGGILSGIKMQISTQADIDTLLFGPSLQSQDVSSTLSTQLDQTASLIDSLTRQVIGQVVGGNFFKNLGVDAIKKLLPSHGDLVKAITKVYSTVLGNRYMNENLYLQLVNVIIKGFEDASTTIL